jgi:Meckel syndrome type 1 protein
MVSNGARPSEDRDWNINRHPDEETLSAYLDRALDPAVRADVAAHLVTCADCRRGLAELRAVVTLLSGLPEIVPPRSFALTPAMVEARQPRVIQWLPRLRVLTAMAAMLLVVSFAGDILTRANLVAPRPAISQTDGVSAPFSVERQQASPNTLRSAAEATTPAAAVAPAAKSAAPTPAAAATTAPAAAPTTAPAARPAAPAATPVPPGTRDGDARPTPQTPPTATPAAASAADQAPAPPAVTPGASPTAEEAAPARAPGGAAGASVPAETTAAARVPEPTPTDDLSASTATDRSAGNETANASAKRAADAPVTEDSAAARWGWGLLQAVFGILTVGLLLTVLLAPRLARSPRRNR